jgi:uncharacterized protein (TIGR02145 family)
VGTAYGDQVSFKTINETGTFTDSRDGSSYKWVKIGDQKWMAENLAYLPSVSSSGQGSSTSPYYYVYGYEGTTVNIAKLRENYHVYGALYNWAAARISCPDGWHLPSDEEWKTLEKNLGMSNSDAGTYGVRYSGTVGGQLKETGTAHWNSPNFGATNSSSFSALPGGWRDDNTGFGGIGNFNYIWTSTDYDGQNAFDRSLDKEHDGISRLYINKRFGFTVRCLKD